MATKKTAATPAPKKKAPPAPALSDEHTGQTRHLCELVSNRQMAQVARAARGAKYLCHICGRAANKPEGLCEPVEI